MISFAAKLAEHASTHPDRPAVSCDGLALSYGDLHRCSNRLANGLWSFGVRKGDLVSIALPNSVDFVAVCHAVWKLGATPQPLSFRLPSAELAAIVALAAPALVIGQVDDAERGFTSVARIEAANASDSDLPDVVAPVAKAPTSGGSTGRPSSSSRGRRG